MEKHQQHNHKKEVKLKDLVTGGASSSAPVSQVAHMRLCCPLLVHGSVSLLQLAPLTPVLTTVIQRLVYLTASSSVEAFASTLCPLAIDHHTDHEEENAAQHGKEHGEENGDAAHPLFDGTH